MKKKLPTLLVDFDGVIHNYSKGWHDGTAYDEPMEGAKEAMHRLMATWDVVIFSTRPEEQIKEWMLIHSFYPFKVTNVKIPARAIIDDRAIRFENWDQALSELTSHYGAQDTL